MCIIILKRFILQSFLLERYLFSLVENTTSYVANCIMTHSETVITLFAPLRPDLMATEEELEMELSRPPRPSRPLPGQLLSSAVWTWLRSRNQREKHMEQHVAPPTAEAPRQRPRRTSYSVPKAAHCQWAAFCGSLSVARRDRRARKGGEKTHLLGYELSLIGWLFLTQCFCPRATQS